LWGRDRKSERGGTKEERERERGKTIEGKRGKRERD